MDDLVEFRRFREEVELDEGIEVEAREQLLAAIADEAKPRKRMSAGRVTALLAAAMLVPAGGFAVASLTESSGEVQDEAGNPVGVTSCPAADDAFRGAGVSPPTVYADRCPTEAEIAERIPTLREAGEDRARLLDLEARGAPSTP